jgi:hypothetical protein
MDAVQTELYAQQQYIKMGLYQILKNQMLIFGLLADGEFTPGMKVAYDISDTVADSYFEDLDIFFDDEDMEPTPSPPDNSP